MMFDLKQLLSTAFLVAVLIFIGLLVGYLRIGKIKVGPSGALGVAMIFGAVSAYQQMPDAFLDPLLGQELCSFLSSFGTALFLAVTSISCGIAFAKCSFTHGIKAFLGGACVVLIGGLVLLLFFFFWGEERRALLFGLFSGGMTSTPTLAMLHELTSGEAWVATGYGMAYPFGLFGIVFFVQGMSKSRKHLTNEKKEKAVVSGSKHGGELLWLFGVIVAGIVLGSICFWKITLGTTLGILLSGLLIGYLYFGRHQKSFQLEEIRSLGLVLFFVGAGFPAGATLTNSFMISGLLPAIFIPFCAIFLGYMVLRYAFRFTKSESLAVLCGGMTSTPAIVVLQEKEQKTDIFLYTPAYVGALSALVLVVRIVFAITGRG